MPRRMRCLLAAASSSRCRPTTNYDIGNELRFGRKHERPTCSENPGEIMGEKRHKKLGEKKPPLVFTRLGFFSPKIPPKFSPPVFGQISPAEWAQPPLEFGACVRHRAWPI